MIDCAIDPATEPTEDNHMSLIEAGAAAPSFTLPNHDGTPVKLDDLAGRYVLLWWYPKADTPG